MINGKMAVEANENFYKAFNSRDLDAMKMVVCAHIFLSTRLRLQ